MTAELFIQTHPGTSPKNKRATSCRGPSLPAAPERTIYRCSLPGLTGFYGLSSHGTGSPAKNRQKWRRRRDSNPRDVAAQTLSKRPPSTTRPLLRKSTHIVKWRREWDLNPRDGSSPPRRFRVARLRPLGHLSTPCPVTFSPGPEELPEHFSTFFGEYATCNLAPVVQP